MGLLKTLILGVVQGASEFLPISSTAHLILVPWFLNWEDPGLTFDIALHFGTLLSIIVFFWKDWWMMFKALRLLATKFFGKSQKSGQTSRVLRLFWLLLLATIPGVIFGILLESQVETIFRSPLLIASTLAVFALILWLIDIWAPQSFDLNHLSKSGALFIGLAQALALIPGVSRSGITIVGGLLAGLTREAAVRFSFLLSAPIIFGSTIMALRKLGSLNNIGELEIGNLALGILISFLSGFLAIKFLLKYVRGNSFSSFVIYRLVLAGFILFWWLRVSP